VRRTGEGLPAKFPVNLPDAIYYAFAAGRANRDRADAMRSARESRGRGMPAMTRCMVDSARDANRDMVRNLIKARGYLAEVPRGTRGKL
jgi:hypothetical protein